MDTNSLIKAIEFSEKAFNLLNWLEDAIEKGIISADSALSFITNPIIAKEWIIEHNKNFPTIAKPDSLEIENLQPFINLFSSLGLTSFEINKNPGVRYVPPFIRGDSPSYVKNKYIIPVKLTKRDKNKSQQDKLKELASLTESLGYDNLKLIESIVDDKKMAKFISLYSYCELLIKRMNGKHSGKTHLVLWREFAWTKKGSPIKKFKLTETLYLESRERIIEELHLVNSVLVKESERF